MKTPVYFRAQLSYGLVEYKILSEHKIQPLCWQKEWSKHAKVLLQNGWLQNITTAANFNLLVFDVSDIQKMEQLMNSCHFNRQMKIERILNIRQKKVYPRSLGETIAINYTCIILLNKNMPLDYLQSLMPSLSIC